VVNFRPQQLYAREKTLKRRLGGSESGSGEFRRRENFASAGIRAKDLQDRS